MTWKLLLGGLGGQGIVSAGVALGEAVVIDEGRYAVQTQTYGAQMRGGVSCSHVTIADSEILYPKIEQAHLVAVLHQNALPSVLPVLRPGGFLVIDSDQVQVDQRVDAKLFELPIESAIRHAFGSTQNVNLSVLGAIVTISRCVQIGSLRDSVRRRFGESNDFQRAIDVGVGLADS